MWSARRGACRVVYEIDDDQAMITVLRIGHPPDAYRPRWRCSLRLRGNSCLR
ncbi:MAG: type II toxin-antitoxin system RelE/ParE family toxin [Ilumatobacteraceae bacterium]|nr:type II toxin-antitoxin system RelE/ParE family toxin [Ilumatobacteraceae bacterium]